ncbi:hypothetical protein [Frigoribacterium sp. Leaf44]|uniref:hypothetical protein n=1 Tax=Frigoribacterium sp. Leaf44 TaxID=1736220 RepID=UPI00138F2ABE|nr:hypothetical protein [Frigoribacterium sp. Leaf44]
MRRNTASVVPPGQNRPKRAAVLVQRLADQGMWSLAFFLFNLHAASTLSTEEFAALTVATSTGVIVAACVRAFAIDGRVIAGAKLSLSASASTSLATIAVSSGAGAVVATASALVWIHLGAGGATGLIPVVAGLIVLADTPHYGLTMQGRYVRALSPAAVYLLAALIVLIVTLSSQEASVLLVWSVGLTAAAFVAWIASRGAPGRGVTGLMIGVQTRLAAESLYAALASQLGILILFLVSAPADTAGIRLAYSIVFAPVFSLIQGLTPLLLTRMVEPEDGQPSSKRRVMRLWMSAGTTGVVVSGAIGAVLGFSVWEGTTFENVLPFLIPVGASMLGAFMLDAGLLDLRLRSHPRTPHRIRLLLVSVDLLVQLIATLSFGTSGLTFALCAGFVIKAVATGWIFLNARRAAPTHPLETR